jgi:hypothetical protein
VILEASSEITGIYSNSSGGVPFYFGNGNTTIASVLSNNSWTHLAMSNANAVGGTVTVYVNGVSKGTFTSAADSGSTSVYAGWDAGGSDKFVGNIADAAIWNTNLSAGDIANLASGARPNAVQSGSLFHWWPLNGFLNTTEPDLSGNSHTGTLTGTLPILGPPATWRLG